MGALRRTCSTLKAKWLETFVSRPVSVNGGGPLITFTFDDVPRSVLDNAIPVLDHFGIRATLYFALEIRDEGGPYCDESDIESLASDGHEIGCHTLTHYSLRHGSPEGLYDDALEGKRALESILDGHPVDHFSYPFGEVTLRAKMRLQNVFRSMRTSTPGLNVGRVDRNYLRAQPLYGARTDLRRLRSEVARACECGAWLILYTHEVVDQPDDYGTSPRDFRAVVEAAVESGARIATLSQALAAAAPMPDYQDRPLT